MSILGLNTNSSYKYGYTDDLDITVEQINLEDGSMYDLYKECDDAVHEVFLAIYEADCIELQGRADLLLTENVGMNEFEYLLMEADEQDASGEGGVKSDKESKAADIKASLAGATHKIGSKIKNAVGKIMDTIISVLSSMHNKLEQFNMDVANKAKKIYGDGKFSKTPEIKGYDYPLAVALPSASDIFTLIMNKTVTERGMSKFKYGEGEKKGTYADDIVKSAFDEICDFEYGDGSFKNLRSDLYGSDKAQTIKFSEQECQRIYSVLSKGAFKDLVASLRKEINACRTEYRKLASNIESANINAANLCVKALNIAKSSYIKVANMIITAAKAKQAQALKVLKIAYGSKAESTSTDNAQPAEANA